MPSPEKSRQRSTLPWAVAASLVIHALVLLVGRHEPPDERPTPSRNASRLEARLAPRAQVPATPLPLPAPAPAPAPKAAGKPSPRPRLMTAQRGGAPAAPASPTWSAAEKAEMNRFVDELADQARAAPKPTLAQRSLAMARDEGRQQAQQVAAETATLERRPNTAPPDRFTLDMYVDGLIKRLNRSAAYVRNDPRSKGMRVAAVQFRVNPDGSLKSFVVLNAADQQEEIAFIQSVVERAIPFSPFPADLDRAARSLAMTICILPASGGGFGFTRGTDGRGC